MEMTEGHERTRALGGTAARGPQTPKSWLMRASAYAACAWGLVFAAAHLYWLLGGTLGIPLGLALFANKPLLVIDIIAIPLCIIAALLALALVQSWGRRFPWQWLLTAAWAACALFVVHAAPQIPDWVILALGRRTTALTPADRFDLFLYEPWFLVGGILFGVAAWRFQRWSRDQRLGAR